MFTRSWPGPCTRSKAPRTLHRQGGGFRLARSSLPLDDTWGLVVAPCIATSARFRGIPHAGQHALFARNSRREVPSDVTHAPNLRGFPCRPARAYRPGNPLRIVPRTEHAARNMGSFTHAPACGPVRSKFVQHSPSTFSPSTRPTRIPRGVFRTGLRSRRRARAGCA